MDLHNESPYRMLCNGCLSSNRQLYSLDRLSQVCQVFSFILHNSIDGPVPKYFVVCWECHALAKRFAQFKERVNTVQKSLSRGYFMGIPDHTYTTKSLSTLECTIKNDYDLTLNDTAASQRFLAISIPDLGKIDLQQHLKVTTMPDIEVTVPKAETSEETVKDPLRIDVSDVRPRPVNKPLASAASNKKRVTDNNQSQSIMRAVKHRKRVKYLTEYMNEDDMRSYREERKKKDSYATVQNKCEDCILSFDSSEEVQEHNTLRHTPKDGHVPCNVCRVYVPSGSIVTHEYLHRLRYSCEVCGHAASSVRDITMHGETHAPPQDAEDDKSEQKTRGKTKEKQKRHRKKTTVMGYKCPQCDLIFKKWQARKNHIARYHSEGLQCDHCKKRYVNRNTLITHLRLHEGPLPREECPICHKMVRSIQIRYHIRRHQTSTRYKCTECDKVYMHLLSYQMHLKYSRAHATQDVFKFPCPMCTKGYPTKQAMQDHFNYRHLGKTTHKCPICDKPIASLQQVERHIARVHGEKKDKPRDHVCAECGKAFATKKTLNQHQAIHSTERPLTCNICQQTFKQKASLYTHKKRVHHVVHTKPVYVESITQSQ